MFASFDYVRHNLCKRHLNLQLVELISPHFYQIELQAYGPMNLYQQNCLISCNIPHGFPLFHQYCFCFTIPIYSSVNAAMQQQVCLSVNAFIDDTTLLAVSPSTEENCKLLALAHNKCLDWARTHGAVFAPSKYQLIHLSGKRSPSTN